MENNEVILLERLKFVTQAGGKVQPETIKVNSPRPCRQPNAPGELRSFEDLEGFRKEARRIGAACRKAILNG